MGTRTYHVYLVGGAILASLLTAGLTPASSALAKPGSPPTGPQGHCVVPLDEPKTPKCYQTLTQAIAVVTGGAIPDAPARPATAAADPRFLANKQSINKLIGIEYDSTSYASDSWSLTFFGHKDCTLGNEDVDYEHILDPIYWDQISSFKNFSNCWTNHYYFDDFVGASTGYKNDQTVMTITPNLNFDNNSRALRWS